MMVKQMTNLSPRKVGFLDIEQIASVAKFALLDLLSTADIANLKS